ncbi:MAG: beta-galactosidase [Lachnospiraceae bacterium]|nr:beta-galactosidase [Lachnospiraceae bacterium]
MIPRSEHPRPQFVRENWKCLNGTWAFEMDNGRSGLARGLANPDARLSGSILVPFCPQSCLSGVEHKDFILGLWYQRTLEVEETDLVSIVRLHFGAVDDSCTLYVNGQAAGSHTGGYTSFSFDIQDLLHPGTNVLTLQVYDDERDPMIPRGKQSEEFFSHACDYTRTSGIWQSVWVEYLPHTHVESVRMIPSPETCSLTLTADLRGAGEFTAEAFWEGRSMGSVSCSSKGGVHTLTLPLEEEHLWEVGKGGLYDLKLSYKAADMQVNKAAAAQNDCKSDAELPTDIKIATEDKVSSYFGLRSVALTDSAFLLNGKPVFQRTVLDQGFYPDGIYTAPSDEALKGDILLSMDMGFNGARLHQKTFEERFLYHADCLGYLVWDEYGNWGLDHTDTMGVYHFLPQWLEEMERDFNHPAIIGWCPFNETWDRNHKRQYDDLLKVVYLAAKAADPTRPVIDVSGGYHVVTDIYDLHDYTQNPEEFGEHFPLEGKFYDRLEPRQQYEGGPVFVSEYGGIGYDPAYQLSDSDRASAWSYGTAAHSREEYIGRFKGLTDVLLDNPRIMGLCYTQLTDIEQEQNGVYTYDRVPKVEPEVLREILSRRAAIEVE